LKNNRSILFITNFLSLCYYWPNGYCQDSSIVPSPSGPEKSFAYYDADELNIQRDEQIVEAKGHVFFLVGEVFVSADKVHYSKKSGILVAEGNVKFLRGKERIHASRILFDENRKEARIDNAEITADPLIAETALKNEALGLSLAEVAFEASRSQRSKELNSELRALRESYISQRNLESALRQNKNASADIQRRYGQILERFARTKLQPNLVLESLPEGEKIRLKRRREVATQFVRDNPTAAARAAGIQTAPGYIRIRARQLFQTSDGNYELEDATLTPCRCSGNQVPIWGLSARSGHVEPENYVTLYGSTIDVASIPLAYTPWLKFPIKSKRQSGFLLPSIYASRSGDAISQPFFLTLGEHADTTLGVTVFTKRGTRYEGELRSQISPEAKLRLSGESISDTKDREEFESNRIEIADEIKAKEIELKKPLTKEEKSDFLDREGRAHERRWYTNNAVSLPLTAWGSAKVSGEWMSDNKYLSDYGKEVGSTQDLFATSQSSNRFLKQQAAIEYFGEDLALSLRAESLRDTMALELKDTPSRLPRVEYSLLPKRYFGLPMAFESNGSWERVHRVGGSPFVDLKSPVASDVPLGTSQQTVSAGKNDRRDPNEPFVEGDRWNGEASLMLPFPANPFFNAFARSKGIGTQYQFPRINSWNKQTPYQSYLVYDAKIEIPMEGEAKLSLPQDKEQDVSLLQKFVPSVGFTYIPEVKRSNLFPNKSQLFYLEDNALPKKELELALTTGWTINRYEFVANEIPLRRLPEEDDPPVASEQIFLDMIQNQKIKLENQSDEIFKVTKSEQSHELFLEWAEKELQNYEETVLRAEFRKPLVWPSTSSLRRKATWTANPVTLSVSATYNFDAERTADESNKRKGPTENPEKPEVMKYVNGTLTWNTSPMLPLNGSFTGKWRKLWSKFEEAGASVSATLPYKVSATFSNSYTTKAVPDPLKVGEFQYPIVRTLGTNVSWAPLDWLLFQYQKVSKLNSADRIPTAEFEYASLQKVSFLQLQDCLDVSFQRFKDQGISERYAVWSIGINMRFLGQTRPFDSVGESVNREIQKRNEKQDPGAVK
jgi:LPS-assembly protein